MNYRAAVGISLAILLVSAQAQDDPFALDISALNAKSPPPGTIINQGNIDQHVDILDEHVIKLIREEIFTIRVGETFDLPPHPEYREATAEHASKVTLQDGPGGLTGYVAGRPFPVEPDPQDPKAGEKLAWNFRYSWSPESGEITHFYWQYRDMRRDKLERELSFYASQLRFMHRHVVAPLPQLEPNPAGIYNALYLRVVAPPDLRNTQLLIHRAEDDTERDRTWLYVASHRRVRRLASGQTTDAFLGSDIMIEDFLGYNGRIMDMKWNYEGTRDVLLPLYHHADAKRIARKPAQPDGYEFVDFHGKASCFPDVPWQLRRAHVVTADPLTDRHPLSRRRFYIDAQTGLIMYGNNLDRNGKLWKVGYAAFAHPDTHLPINADTHAPVIDSAVMIDLQAEHCTTLQFKSVANSGDLDTNDFSVQALRTKGR